VDLGKNLKAKVSWFIISFFLFASCFDDQFWSRFGLTFLVLEWISEFGWSSLSESGFLHALPTSILVHLRHRFLCMLAQLCFIVNFFSLTLACLIYFDLNFIFLTSVHACLTLLHFFSMHISGCLICFDLHFFDVCVCLFNFASLFFPCILVDAWFTLIHSGSFVFFSYVYGLCTLMCNSILFDIHPCWLVDFESLIDFSPFWLLNAS